MSDTSSPSAAAAFSFDIAALRAGYETGNLTAGMVVAAVLARIAAAGDDGVWISRPTDAALHARAAALDALPADERAALPLYGVPFAVKDNIDAAGLPTTAACPAFAYDPAQSATAVRRLEAAGAILIGKTNLDQFATGLVGVRSPYGIARNPFDPAHVPGGSSSGSAVAVASGLVGFALGTDTAGSGRVPASFNNIVGLKPSKGLIGAAGVVPACRGLDCVSIFALTVEDAMDVLAVAAGPDEDDGFSRTAPPAPPAFPPQFRFGVPRREQLQFFGDDDAARLYDAAVDRLTALGGVPTTIDFAPFAETAALLYSGPWVAERTAAVGDFIDANPGAALPTTAGIIGGGRTRSAVETFRAHYRLADLQTAVSATWGRIDVLLLPTVGTGYSIEQLAADPVALNSNLGIYTNFANLLDLSAIAVPAGFKGNGIPAGVTLFAPAFREAALSRLAAAFQRSAALPLGATGRPTPAARDVVYGDGDLIEIFVVGGHLSGQPLNDQLTRRGALLKGAADAAPLYRLYALPGEPPRPGMVRTAPGEGASVAGEVWALTPADFGAFVAAVPSPLSIGKVTLADRRVVAGFLCEPAGVVDAVDITGFGGWRAYRASLTPDA